MFKGLKGGRRNASPTPQTARISGLNTQRQSTPPHPRTVAFQPETPQGHGFDSNSSRVSEISK
jgi:hypothetical protein